MGFSGNTRYWAGLTAQDLSLKEAEQLSSESLQVVQLWEDKSYKSPDDPGFYTQAYCICSALEAPLVSLKYGDEAGNEYEVQLTPETKVITDKAATPARTLKPKQVLKSAHNVEAKFTVISVEPLPDGKTYNVHLQEEAPTSWLDLQHLVIQVQAIQN